jgi:nitrite reductase/ring-hydroxylating ferredoxin subunit
LKYRVREVAGWFVIGPSGIASWNIGTQDMNKIEEYKKEKDGLDIILFTICRATPRLCAIQNICPHEGGQLAQGWIDGDAVVCPLHGYKFNLQTGACLDHAGLHAKVFDLIEVGDHFKIDRSSKARRE